MQNSRLFTCGLRLSDPTVCEDSSGLIGTRTWAGWADNGKMARQPPSENWPGQGRDPRRASLPTGTTRGTAAPSAKLATGSERRGDGRPGRGEERTGGELEHVALCDFCAQLNDSTYKVLQNCGCNSVSMCFCGLCLQVCALYGMCNCLEQSVCVCVCVCALRSCQWVKERERGRERELMLQLFVSSAGVSLGWKEQSGGTKVPPPLWHTFLTALQLTSHRKKYTHTHTDTHTAENNPHVDRQI